MEIFGNKIKTEGGADITFNDMSFMPAFVALERKFEDECSAFHDKLMKMGVKSYRCNDGWVNRKKNIITFTSSNSKGYYWNGGRLKIGDKIFIGNMNDGGRFAVVTDVHSEDSSFLDSYGYRLTKEIIEGREHSVIIEYNEREGKFDTLGSCLFEFHDMITL